MLVGIAIRIVRIGAGLASYDAVKHRPNGILGAFTDLMTGFALEEYLLTERRILSARRTERTQQYQSQQCRSHQRNGSASVNSSICHWPIRDLVIALPN